MTTITNTKARYGAAKKSGFFKVLAHAILTANKAYRDRVKLANLQESHLADMGIDPKDVPGRAKSEWSAKSWTIR